MSNESVLSLG